MSDLIERKAAIEALHTRFRGGFEEDKWWNSTHVLAALEDVPSAQTDRKKGKWLGEDDAPVAMENGCPVRSCYCSECREWLTASDEYYVKGNYCPNCGADMRGEKGEY